MGRLFEIDFGERFGMGGPYNFVVIDFLLYNYNFVQSIFCCTIFYGGMGNNNNS